MNIRITKHDVDCYAACQELMQIAESDIKVAHGESAARPAPSVRTLTLYSEAVRQAEAQAGAVTY